MCSSMRTTFALIMVYVITRLIRVTFRMLHYLKLTKYIAKFEPRKNQRKLTGRSYTTLHAVCTCGAELSMGNTTNKVRSTNSGRQLCSAVLTIPYTNYPFHHPLRQATVFPTMFCVSTLTTQHQTASSPRRGKIVQSLSPGFPKENKHKHI